MNKEWPLGLLFGVLALALLLVAGWKLHHRWHHEERPCPTPAAPSPAPCDPIVGRRVCWGDHWIWKAGRMTRTLAGRGIVQSAARGALIVVRDDGAIAEVDAKEARIVP